MAKYVLVYSSGNIPTDGPARARLMQAWRDWVGRLGDAALDRGNPFGPAATIHPDGQTDDNSISHIKGYMIFSAETLAAATVIARECPHRTVAGGTVEVYETLPID